MSDYISREALIKAVEGNLYVTESVKSYVRCTAKSIPAADVVEVKHAYWNDQECSSCGTDVVDGLDAQKWDYWFPPYCPHCGARMDERREDGVDNS